MSVTIGDGFAKIGVMTALGIAQEECANYCGGRCIGFRITDDLRTVAGKPLAKCVLGTPGISCDYFNACVAPTVRNMDALGPNMEARRKRKAEFEQAIHRYARAANIPIRPILGK